MSWTSAGSLSHHVVRIDVPFSELGDGFDDQPIAMIWSGQAPDARMAAKAARSTLATVTTVLGTVMGGRPISNIDAWSAFKEEDALQNTLESFSVWAALAARYEGLRRKRTWRRDELRSVMEAALRHEMAKMANLGEGATLIASFVDDGPDKGLQRRMDIDLMLAKTTSLQVAQASARLRVAQEAAAAASLASGEQKGEARGEVEIPQSATLRAAFHAHLRATQEVDRAIVSGFLHEVGLGGAAQALWAAAP